MSIWHRDKLNPFIGHTIHISLGQSLTSKQQIVNSVLFMYCLLWSTVGQTESTQALLKILTPFLSRNINQLSWSLNTFREERSCFLLHFLSIRGGRQINVHFFLQPGTCLVSHNLDPSVWVINYFITIVMDERKLIKIFWRHVSIRKLQISCKVPYSYFYNFWMDV